MNFCFLNANLTTYKTYHTFILTQTWPLAIKLTQISIKVHICLWLHKFVMLPLLTTMFGNLKWWFHLFIHSKCILNTCRWVFNLCWLYWVTLGYPTSGIITYLHGRCTKRRPSLSIIRPFGGRQEIICNCQLWLSLGVSSWVKAIKLIHNGSRQMLCYSTACLLLDLAVGLVINEILEEWCHVWFGMIQLT